MSLMTITGTPDADVGCRPCRSVLSAEEHMHHSKHCVSTATIVMRCVAADRVPGGFKLARTPMAAAFTPLGGSPLHPSSPALQATALPITFQVSELLQAG